MQTSANTPTAAEQFYGFHTLLQAEMSEAAEDMRLGQPCTYDSLRTVLKRVLG